MRGSDTTFVFNANGWSYFNSFETAVDNKQHRGQSVSGRCITTGSGYRSFGGRITTELRHRK